jgi:hypothetical protein
MRNGPVVSGNLGAGSATRPVDNLRNKPKVTDLIRDGRGNLTDKSGNHTVALDWELNEQAVKDHIFKLTVDDKEVYIDLEELLFYTRIMFMKG